MNIRRLYVGVLFVSGAFIQAAVVRPLRIEFQKFDSEERTMRRYWTSDYAVNKDREGIVYQFADGKELEISLTEYLRDNPGKTEQDFLELKALSDGIYYEQALEDTRYGKQKQTLGQLEDSEQFATPPIDTLLIHNSEKGQALKAARLLLSSGDLTEVQRRRFLLHFFEGLSYRQLAVREDVHFTSVQESIEAAVRKLQKYLKNF